MKLIIFYVRYLTQKITMSYKSINNFFGTYYYYNNQDSKHFYHFFDLLYQNGSNDEIDYFYKKCVGNSNILLEHLKYMANHNIDLHVNESFVEICKHGNIDKILYFLDLGADINYNNGYALINALWFRFISIKSDTVINILLEQNIILNDEIFIFAIIYNYPPIVKKCLECGLKIMDEHVEKAINSYEIEIMKIFLDFGFDVNKLGTMIIQHFKCSNKDISKQMVYDIIKLLNDYGVDLNAVMNHLI